MARAAKVCGHPQCASLEPCDLHRPKAWAGSTRRTRTISGSRQQKRSRYVLSRDGYLCAVCGGLAKEADHVIPLAEGGHDGPRNMQAICKPCHKAKTQDEARRARTGPILEYTHPTAPYLVAIVGAPGAGKTQIARHLASDHHLPYRSIDDCGPRGHRTQRWATLFAWVAQQQGCALTESNVIPPAYARLLDRTPHVVIEVVAPDHIRRQRLDDRGDMDWALTAHPIGYQVDHTVVGGPAGKAAADRAIEATQQEAQRGRVA